MRCRTGPRKLLYVTDTTAVHSPKYPRDCVRRASGLVLTRQSEKTEARSDTRDNEPDAH